MLMGFTRSLLQFARQAWAWLRRCLSTLLPCRPLSPQASARSPIAAPTEQHEFEVVLIDDLSRLARNTLLMLSVLEELRFNRVRVLSVADGLFPS
jgi:hypothetical protein